MKRRELIKMGLMSGVAGLTLTGRGTQAQLLCKSKPTPEQTQGPFYPLVKQLDEDSDLVLVNGRSQEALGKIVIVQGMVTDQSCIPVKGALVEIWQACESGRYNHHRDPNPAALDPNFQYWGEAVTNEAGLYRFRTIIPGAYPTDRTWMRPPHIHFKITRLGYQELITQMYFEGEVYNEQDLILQALPLEEQSRVVVNFKTEEGQLYPVGNFPIQIQKIRS